MSNTYEVRMTPGQRLRHARTESGVDQSVVAERLGIDRSKVSNWERGVQAIDFESAKRLGKVTGAPWWWLLGYDSLEGALEPASTIWYRRFPCSRALSLVRAA